MRWSRVPAAVALACVLAACQPINGEIAPTPSPTTTEPQWEPLLAPDELAGNGDIAFESPEPYRGNFWFGLRVTGWEEHEEAGSVAFRRSANGCVATFTDSPLAAQRADVSDRAASDDLLSQVATLPAVEPPRRGVWVSDPSFDIVHALGADAERASYVAVRAFVAIARELVVRLDCPTLKQLRDAYPDIRSSGWTIASLTHGSIATEEAIGPYAVHIPIDHGPAPHARGQVQLDAAGVPVRYTVAPDDEYGHIARRFGLYAIAAPDPVSGYNTFTGYLTVLNSVRRGEQPWTLYAGDTLNLSPYTVTSVGSINGQVTTLPPPHPLPPQR